MPTEYKRKRYHLFKKTFCKTCVICGKTFVAADARHCDESDDCGEKDNKCKACQAPSLLLPGSMPARRDVVVNAPTLEARIRSSYGEFTVHLMKPNGFTAGQQLSSY